MTESCIKRPLRISSLNQRALMRWCPDSESNQDTGIFNPLLYRLSYPGNGAH